MVYCFRSQRYKILKPIHNNPISSASNALLFQITKIQNFETNSQLIGRFSHCISTVSDHKDTKFWNQFTTVPFLGVQDYLLFQITKIQNFETNSQLEWLLVHCLLYCFRSQRYKILKPIHNLQHMYLNTHFTVSDHKDTKFWNQFTTSETYFSETEYCFRSQRYKILKPIHNRNALSAAYPELFQITKIQNFETNSQRV